MSSPIIVCKSTFDIRAFNKKSITVGLLINKQISIILQLECKLSKKIVTLNLEEWFTLMSESNYNSITNNLHTRCRRVKITDDFTYSINIKQSSINLHINDAYITLSHIDFCRLKQLQHCVDLYIVEKQKRLPSYQATFNTAYELIKNDVRGLPDTCQRNEFTNQYIQNYDFNYYSHLQNDDTSFLYEILQFHFNTMSDMILQDLIV